MQQVRQRHISNDYSKHQGSTHFEDLPDNQVLSGSEEDLYPQYPEEDIQTLHVYLYEEKPPLWTKDQMIALSMGILALALIVGLCFIPNGPSYRIQTITVPARFHSLQLQARVPIHATGEKTSPATNARGILTIYNGSFLAQQLPAHFIVTTSSGREVATRQAVLIPGANLPSLGIAMVPAYAVLPGSQGNIQPYTLQATYGGSIEVKTLSAFTGGQDASTKTFFTANDKTTALETARAQLTAKQPIGLQSHPCRENVSQQSSSIVVTWLCQYATYQAPKEVEMLSVHLSGTHVVLTVRIITRSVTTHFVK